MKTLHDIEQIVHAGIENGDPETLEQYVEHAVDNLDADHLRDLVLALINNDNAGKQLALMKIESRIDRQRAEFTEMEALRRARLAEDMEFAA